MGIEVATHELQRQQRDSGVTHVVIMPFPSTAIQTNRINDQVLEETARVSNFTPYHYIRENYEDELFDPIPQPYFGGKWHWMRGVQDSASNYRILEDAALAPLCEKIRITGKPVIFEEEFEFTRRFVEMFPRLFFIIPHLGLLGGDSLDFLKAFKKHEHIYFDTALAAEDTILEFVRSVGAERVLFGSDVPFGSMKRELSKILALPLGRDDKERILYKNVRDLAHLTL